MTHTRLEQAEEIKPFIVQLRRTIHKKPELGFEAHATAKLVADTLRDLGIEVQTGVGKTGVVGNLGDRDGPSGRAIGNDLAEGTVRETRADIQRADLPQVEMHQMDAVQPAGFTRIEISSEDADFVFAHEDVWWASLWSHGMRGPLERLEPAVLERVKRAMFHKVQGLKQSDGIHTPMRVLFAQGTKSRSETQ